MTRISSVVFVIAASALVSLGTGCNKPSEDSCRKALGNMRLLLGTENLNSNADLDGDVRRCRGGSSKKAVECATKATTLDELRACDFMKLADKKPAAPAGSAAGSAAVPAGSAAPAAAPAGSAAPAAAPAGSAAPAAGSATSPAAGSGSAY